MICKRRCFQMSPKAFRIPGYLKKNSFRRSLSVFISQERDIRNNVVWVPSRKYIHFQSLTYFLKWYLIILLCVSVYQHCWELQNKDSLDLNISLCVVSSKKEMRSLPSRFSSCESLNQVRRKKTHPMLLAFLSSHPFHIRYCFPQTWGDWDTRRETNTTIPHSLNPVPATVSWTQNKSRN